MSFLAGQKVTAAQLNALLAEFATYVPANTNITVGNGVQTARYAQQGDLVVVNYNLVFGSTTTIASVARVGLPVAVGGGADAVASVRYTNASGSPTHAQGLAAAVVGNSDVALISNDGSTVSATNPFTWTTDDAIRLSVVYEA